jgi:N-acetylglucosaminyldiphosphoundecaprenol N-acetyl-beta-D-mannosaminyltransferase
MISSDETVNVLGFPTSTLDRDRLLETVRGWIQDRSQSRHLMALNPIKVCRARKERALAEHIFNADLVYPDAFGISWAMRRITGRPFEAIPGCDLMYDIMNLASTNGWRVFLLGATERTVQETRRHFENRYPGARIVGARNGYFQSESEKVSALTSIAESRPDVVFVGMGALVQEEWIARIATAARESNVVIPLLMGVGGSFDAVTGNVPRPPQWMLRVHLEWLFRLIQQPFRAPRMVAIPKFALLVLAKKYLHFDTDYVRSSSPASHSNADLARLEA